MENVPFATLLRRHRVSAGLSQEALAERAGLSVRAISDLERGARRAPYRETVHLLADALLLSDGDRKALETAVDRRRSPLSGAETPLATAPTLPAAVTSLIGRDPEIAALRDESSEERSEVAAREANLTFIKLDGNVGCVVNGAGLAMATMDLVKYYGGEPANFLDIGGSSNPEKVVNALRIITSDPNVKAILFNIFGGITRTDDVANGIVTAIRENPLKVPLVIRLTGTNEEIALKILTENGLSAMTDMDEAVKKAVALATGSKVA